MTREFAGKVVVITGGSRGIGRGIAAAFAAEGAQTVLAASSSSTLEAAADAIAQSGAIRPDICAADEGPVEQVQELLDQALRRLAPDGEHLPRRSADLGSWSGI